MVLSGEDAGAAFRISVGLCVTSGMLTSTCLTVLFVPCYFVPLQRLAERWRPVKTPAREPEAG